MNISQEKQNKKQDKGLGEIKHKNFESKNHKLVFFTLLSLIPYVAFATYIAITNNVYLFDFDGTNLPVWQTIILAIGAFIFMFLLPLLSMKTVDELETLINMKACALGILGTIAIYPSWRILSYSNITPAPTADQTFLLVLITALASYIIIKIRS